MKRIWILLLAALVLLGSGCRAREGEPSSPESLPEPENFREGPLPSGAGEETAGRDELSAEPGTASQEENLLLREGVRLSSGGEELLDGEEGTTLPSGSLTVDFSGEEQILWGEGVFTGPGELTVSREGEILYRQELEAGRRLFWLGEAAETLTFSWRGEGRWAELALFDTGPEEESFILSGYYPVSGSISQAPPEEAVTDRLTDVFLISGAAWGESGQVEIVDEGYSAALENLRQAQSHGVRVWSTLMPRGALVRQGTAGNLMDTPEKRLALAQAVAEHAGEYGLDGVDLDWEFPRGEEWEYFSLWLPELAEALHREGRLLCLTLYPDRADFPEEELAAVAACVDRVNVMAYDLFDREGRHSTYETALSALSAFRQMGFAPEKLCLGLPLYGRPADGSARWDLYNTLTAEDPADNWQGDSYFNGLYLLQDKTLAALEEGCCGVMLYHLDCDVSPGDGRWVLGALWELGQALHRN